MADPISHPPSPAPRSPSPAAPPKSTDETIKETFESIVIAFILAFIFRAYVVEAFVIPTGSMAPTLLGQHVKAACPQCGYRFDVDASGKTHTDSDRPMPTPCPMCHYPAELPPSTPTRAGDRLLVQKYIYHVAEPRRWDVVVFRNPQSHNENGSPGPTTNYIKRLVGLPHENLYILDGNVYVKPLDSPDSAWRIARKTDPRANRHWESIQRAVWQPIYHSSYVPLDHGEATPPPTPFDPESQTHPPTWRRFTWRPPWRPTVAHDMRWDLGNQDEGWRRTYRFDPHNDPSKPTPSRRGLPGLPGEELPGGAGELTFDWHGYGDSGAVYPYNYGSGNRGIVSGQPIEDLRLALGVEPQGPDVSLELTTTARLDGDASEPLTARFEPGGRILLTRGEQPGAAALASADSGRPLRPGTRTDLEFWFVDQEALVFVNGRVVLRHAFDVPLEKLKQRPEADDHPRVSIRVAGGAAALHDVELDRDLYYTSSLATTTAVFARVGVLRRDGQGRVAESRPLRIEADRFFVLGDNSPISNDARFWDTVHPWIERQMIRESEREASAAGDTSGHGVRRNPLIRDHTHVVPRSLMIGRAFFIYYPAPFALGRDGKQMLPNFGDMRMVR